MSASIMRPAKYRGRNERVHGTNKSMPRLGMIAQCGLYIRDSHGSDDPCAVI